jgi:DNA-binding NtrC family response regulator
MILFLEDNQNISGFFYKLLSTHHLDYKHFSTINACEEYLLEHSASINLILMNTIMNERDMLSATTYLKKKHKLCVPIIAYTDSDIIEHSMRAKQTGIFEFFALPALPYDIAYAIQDSLSQKKTSPIEIKSSYDQAHLPQKDFIAHKGIGEVVGQYINKYFQSHDDLPPPNGLYDRIISEIEPHIIKETLKFTHGNRIRAAELLGVNRNTLRKKMASYNLNNIAEILIEN